jgi:hypothetical protein
VVPAEKKEVVRIEDLVTEQKTNGFETLQAPVDVIPEKEIIGIWRIVTHIKEAQEVMELAVNVTADCDGRTEFKENRLVHEDLADSGTDPFKLVKRETGWNVGRLIAKGQKLVDDRLDALGPFHPESQTSISIQYFSEPSQIQWVIHMFIYTDKAWRHQDILELAPQNYNIFIE